jgi:two-component system phosphate regulon sensor histidine kinase PhoR
MPAWLSEPWWQTWWRLGLLLGVALLLGWALSELWAALAIALALALAWHYWRLRGLLLQLESARRLEPAHAAGVFGALERGLHRRQGSRRGRVQRLLRMLRVYRQAAAILPDAVLVLDASGERVLWFNQAATRLLGLRQPQDLERPLRELLPSSQLAAWLDATPDEPLLDLPSPVDESLRLSLRLLPYNDSQRLLVARDISKLMRLEQTRRDFVANVSHELRTPLTVVHGYLDLLDPEELPELATMLREMRGQSRRMTQIVEDLLTLSRLEVQERVAEEHVAMRSLLATLRREALALSAGQHEIVLEDRACCDLLGSTKELHSAFSNLVSNAVRYTPAGGRIRIVFERESDGARLAVIDTGHGIPSQHIPRITERFYRVSTSRSRETGGTGLGLSIVKHVLNLHQARLSIESDVGRGSTFACHFGAQRLLARAGDAGEAA